MVPSKRDACAAAARATGETPPVGSAGAAGFAGFFAAGFGLLAFEVTEVKKAQVSKRPKAERSCGPVMSVTPPVLTTCARTTRGETPRWSTLMRLKRPCR